LPSNIHARTNEADAGWKNQKPLSRELNASGYESLHGGRIVSLIRILAVVGAVALGTGLNGQEQHSQEQPSMSYGTARISLGMTAEQVEQVLSDGARHIKFLPDKITAIVYQNGVSDDFEGQITFGDGHVIYATYQMPTAHNADELAQEIAGAVDSMEAKSCTISNYAAHGTGGGFSESSFECGSRRFSVYTVQTLGSSARTINVHLEIGHTPAK
jgi:hypothetical protein